MKVHRSCLLEALATGLAYTLRAEGFVKTWIMLLRLASEDPRWFSAESVHEVANLLIALGEERARAGDEAWREPCADFARQLRQCFGGGPCDAREDEFAALAAKYPGKKDTAKTPDR